MLDLKAEIRRTAASVKPGASDCQAGDELSQMTDTGSLVRSQDDVAAILRASISPVSFWAPEQIGPQPAWLEHAPFGFWLIESLRPRLLVELGTHGGYSYFAFCQAVQRLGLDTRCYAVDTWTGDEHAGIYGEEVYERVWGRNETLYAAFSTLIRSTFDAALSHFHDATIDLLHIDGRHFYEDVKHDFENWRPKLSERSVIVFHDTNVRDRGFGVFKLWQELRDQYPHFEFVHGHGLGVLGIGSETPAAMRALFAMTADAGATEMIRNAYGRLGLTMSLQLQAERRHIELTQAGAAVSHAEHALQTRSEELQRLSSNLAAAEQHASELSREVDARAQQLDLRAGELSSAQALTQDLTATVAKLSRELEHAQQSLLGSQAETSRVNDELEMSRSEFARAKAAFLDGERMAQNEIEILRDRLVDAEAALARFTRGRRRRFTRIPCALSRRDKRELVDCGLFNTEWYLHQYPEAAQGRRSPLEHYLREGYLRGCRPNPLFDTRWYLRRYEDVRDAGINPLAHYFIRGWREGRDPSAAFDTQFYLQDNPDVRMRGVNPLAHYLLFGSHEGRLPTRPQPVTAAAGGTELES